MGYLRRREGGHCPPRVHVLGDARGLALLWLPCLLVGALVARRLGLLRAAELWTLIVVGLVPMIGQRLSLPIIVGSIEPGIPLFVFTLGSSLSLLGLPDHAALYPVLYAWPVAVASGAWIAWILLGDRLLPMLGRTATRKAL